MEIGVRVEDSDPLNNDNGPGELPRPFRVSGSCWCRSLDSLRSLGMTGVVSHPLIPAFPHPRYEVAPAAINLRASRSGSKRTSTFSSKIMFAGLEAE